MKKLLSLLLIVFLTTVTVACQTTEGTTTTTTTTTSDTTDTTTTEQTIESFVTSLSGSNPFNIGLFITDDPLTSIGINFMLSVETEAYVEYHQSDLDNFLQVDAVSKVTQVGSRTVYLYEAEMTGLTPGETYEYFVSSSDGSERSDSYEFTLPSETDQSFTFMYLADPQATAVTGYMAYAYSILNVLDYSELTYDFVVSPGDNVNDSDVRSEWNWFFEYSSFFITEKPFVTTLGNHEGGSIDEERINRLEFDGYFNLPNNGPSYNPFDEIEGDVRNESFDDGKTYSFNYGDAHFLVINTETLCDGTTACGEYDETNVNVLEQWIRNDLQNNAQAWTIALMHRGPYGLSYDTYNVRDILVPIFDEFGVDLVLTGHEHQYSRAVYSGSVMVPFQTSDNYDLGVLTLVQDELNNRNFNDYPSSLGVTYLTGNTASIKFYGGVNSSGLEVQFGFSDANPVIPFITVTEDSIHVVSYGVSKGTALDIVPTGVYLLEEFTITK